MSFSLYLRPDAPFMKRVFGIETEYGITVNGVETVDVVAESIELVRCYTEHGALMKWDYDLEDPHLDARGFRAEALMQDTDESAYYELDKNRPLSFEEIKSDLVLSNGARFYNDHAHPEYSTPECTRLRDIVAQDKAGERILSECVRRRNKKISPEREVRLYKNNTDFAGAGKMGVEGEGSSGQPGIYQISQRSDFFSVLVSIDTMNRRPIVNTRDEPHADPGKYRRFHVILGDANMSEFATAMKIGTTSLVLELIEKREAPQLEVAQPIDATKSISRDQTYDWIIELKDGRKISAIDVQRMYLEKALKHCDRTDQESAWLLQEWEGILNDLEVDAMRCVDRIDWVAKKYLLNTFQESEGLSWTDPWLQSIDLEYHNVAWEQGLYYELVRQNHVRRILKEDEIKTAIFMPPETTRAYFRGRAVARFTPQIHTIHWDEIVFGQDSGQRRVSFNHASDDERIDRLNSLIREANNYEDFLRRLEKFV